MSAHTTTNGHLGFLESESRRRGYYQLVEGVNPELLVHDTVRVIDILDLDMKSDQKILVESIQKSILSVTSVPSPEVVTPPLRMIFHTSDEPDDDDDTYRLNGLHRLIQFYNIPSSFLSERVQGVAHSFGVRESLDHRYDSWFHYLCKNVRTRDDPRGGGARDIAPWPSCSDDPANAESAVTVVPFARRLLKQFKSVMRFSRFFDLVRDQMPFTLWKRPSSCNSQDNNEESIETNDTELEIMGPSNAEDYSWIMGGCFTSWDRQNGRLVLLFFGDQSILEVEKRLQNFLSSPENANAAIRDPYVLHAVILDELFFTMDSTVWELLKVFRGIEKDTYQDASQQHEKIIKMKHAQLDFVRLHNVAKHVIHLLESSEAAIQTIKCMQSAHQKLLSGEEHTANLDTIVRALNRIQGSAQDISTSSKDDNSKSVLENFVRRETESNLHYIMGLFQSTNLRLRSLEKRMNNTVNLSFQLHNQMDSIMLQGDSISMRTIAIVTLIFLPTNTVATIFGVESFGEQSKGIVNGLSKTFGIFWSVAIPITVMTLILWQVAHQRSLRMRHNFMASISSAEKGEKRRATGLFADGIRGDVLRAFTA